MITKEVGDSLIKTSKCTLAKVMFVKNRKKSELHYSGVPRALSLLTSTIMGMPITDSWRRAIVSYLLIWLFLSSILDDHHCMLLDQKALEAQFWMQIEILCQQKPSRTLHDSRLLKI